MSTAGVRSSPHATDVHPSAVGSATQPQTGESTSTQKSKTGRTDSTTSNNRTTTNGDSTVTEDDSTSDTGNAPSDLGPEGYPEQKHAGAVGYGPQYNQGAGMGEKIIGLKEQLKGKVTHNPALVEQGRDRKTGELKKKQMEDDGDPFATPDDKKQTPNEPEKEHKEEAATVAPGPEGTQEAEGQRKGEAVDDVKQI